MYIVMGFCCCIIYHFISVTFADKIRLNHFRQPIQQIKYFQVIFLAPFCTRGIQNCLSSIESEHAHKHSRETDFTTGAKPNWSNQHLKYFHPNLLGVDSGAHTGCWHIALSFAGRYFSYPLVKPVQESKPLLEIFARVFACIPQEDVCQREVVAERQ